MEENAECMLVIIHCPAARLRGNLTSGGATLEGKKELIGFQVGVRDSAQSWHELLSDIKPSHHPSRVIRAKSATKGLVA